MPDSKHPGARDNRGETLPAQGEAQRRTPREPYEADQSASSQTAEDPTMGRMGRLAHDAVVQGQQDTSKSQALDATYHEVRKDDGKR